MVSKLFEQGSDVFEQGDYDRAFKLFRKGAEEGDVDCMGQLATMYSHGDGTPMNFDKSLEWDRKAFEAGSKSSLYNMAITYRMMGDILQYKSMLEKAVETGDSEAALLLAKLYMISDKENDNIIKYLGIVIDESDSFEASIEEAKELLSKIQR